MSGPTEEVPAMSLLGVPVRRPALQTAYWMPHELYDETDDRDHPVLVVSVDEVTRMAQVVTRTSNVGAGGPRAVSHPPEPQLQLDKPGWWRVFKRHHVPWVHFADEDVDVLGKIDAKTWERVLQALTGTEGPL
ncbi:hypothetical protein [Kribbella speibonae]|uniref:Type II toxin-antitoxin system PemK/MazF family toxin n=1 Tax=Kribbella speibonae TaxID=1572660 RepID=A0A4V2M3S6_9ACTN|nr:hypothetical protein [Kribbella speibonae]TCC33222.1 hypothetical protein E0H92_34320 [Kribbella speibonae]